jgi:isoleucyl-tRNA synthetase
VDLSAFYLDILKDRLYTSPAKSLARKSAQTVMYAISDAMIKLMAPLLPFTAEEVWKYMPAVQNKAESIHMLMLPEINAAWNNEALAQKWEIILKVRSDVAKALEEARVKKIIGHSLDAAVTIYAEGDAAAVLREYAEILRDVFIISRASVSNSPLNGAYQSKEIQGVSILVESAGGQKCERCWVYEDSVGSFADHPTICHRCHGALTQIA